MADDTSLPWWTTTDTAWFEAVESWPWEQDGPDAVKRGACPRCEHQMDRTVRGGVLSLDAPAEPAVTLVWCNCTEPHQGRPEDEDGGCGQNARITAPS